jgi:hypothetical protein
MHCSLLTILSPDEKALCPSLVFSDTTSNPFRHLISTIRTFPGISSAVMALAVCHKYHNSTGTPLLLQQKTVQSGGNVARPSKESYPDADNGALGQVLSLKQKSMFFLSAEIADDKANSKSAAIATIFLLAILEMWETGWGAWYTHVEGAKNFIQDLHTTSRDNRTISLEGIVASISVYVFPSCLHSS